MTNYEAIKAMDMHGLAGFLSSITTCGDCPACRDCPVFGDCPAFGDRDGHGVCTEVMLEWLTGECTEAMLEWLTYELVGLAPDHYSWKGTECKKVIELMTRGLSGAEAYYMGNIIKYLYRYPKKGTLIGDLSKAVEYMELLRELFVKGGGKA